METVYLISAGYEWVCPHCESLNQEIEFAESVACEQCGVAFEVADAAHAHA